MIVILLIIVMKNAHGGCVIDTCWADEQKVWVRSRVGSEWGFRPCVRSGLGYGGWGGSFLSDI